jgi:hypothetical protein
MIDGVRHARRDDDPPLECTMCHGREGRRQPVGSYRRFWYGVVTEGIGPNSLPATLQQPEHAMILA